MKKELTYAFACLCLGAVLALSAAFVGARSTVSRPLGDPFLMTGCSTRSQQVPLFVSRLQVCRDAAASCDGRICCNTSQTTDQSLLADPAGAALPHTSISQR